MFGFGHSIFRFVVVSLSFLLLWLWLPGCGTTEPSGELLSDASLSDSRVEPPYKDSVSDSSSTEIERLPESTAVNWRGKRYCEVLLVVMKDSQLVAKVYNSFGLGDCPDSDWKALDVEQIKKATNALQVLLNGPRYWLMNRVTGENSNREIKRFGNIPMFLAATLKVDPKMMSSRKPYTERSVLRTTEFYFRAGEVVYQLRSPQGEQYTMQSYSLQVDSKQSEASLSQLGARLKLPTGWKFNAFKLKRDLRLKVEGVATVIQDDVQNTYQKHSVP